MKKLHSLLLALFLSVSLAACAVPSAATPTNNETPSPVGAVVFADPELEALIRGTLGLPEGDIPLTQAHAVTRLDLSNTWQQYLTEVTPVTDLSGLENFINLETLDLSAHAVSDISQLQGLTNLNSLSLARNPVTDLSPLAGLTNLKFLNLSGSQAQDYGALANLVSLQVLLLDHSTITDLSPLSGLTALQHLYLAKSSAEDLSLLENIYPNLEGKDFTITSTLAELGFQLDHNRHQAFFDGEDAYFTIHHAAWGSPPEEWDANIIRTSMYLEGGYKMLLGFYGDLDAYVFMMDKDGQQVMNYVYDAAIGSTNLEPQERESVEQVILAAMDVLEGEDPLLAPVRIFNDIVKDTFGLSADRLYSLPYEPPNLKNLGFYADEANAVYLYEYRSENFLDDVNMEVHRPEWGEKEFDVRFFTPLSDDYRIVVTWHAVDRKLIASVDDNSQGGGSFEYFIDTGEHVDIWCSYKDKTVEEYFSKAYNDPAIEDVYQHSVDLMTQYVMDTFGMTLEELLSLPTGE